MCNPIENISLPSQNPQPLGHKQHASADVGSLLSAKDQIVVLIFPFHSSITIIRSQQRGHSINLEKSLPSGHCVFFIILTSWSFLSIQCGVYIGQTKLVERQNGKMGQNWVKACLSLEGGHPLCRQKRLLSLRLMQEQTQKKTKQKAVFTHHTSSYLMRIHYLEWFPVRCYTPHPPGDIHSHPTIKPTHL